MAQRVSLLNKTKGTLPRVPFSRIKNAVLGTTYELSLVFVGDAESQKINMTHRSKDYIPNVLSFELSEDSGEMFINPFEARRQSAGFGRSYTSMITFLYIHGLCHLKGMQHGSTMEKSEAKLRKKFGID
jgi:probable rRNA maturation factor